MPYRGTASGCLLRQASTRRLQYRSVTAGHLCLGMLSWFIFAALWCRSGEKDMRNYFLEVGPSMNNVVVMAAMWRATPALWAALDILCKDTNKAVEASSATVKSIRRLASPWHVLWCLSTVAQQVYRQSGAAASSAVAQPQSPFAKVTLLFMLPGAQRAQFT